LLLAVVGACVVAFLYYRPVRAYLETRDALARRIAEVQSLAARKERLEKRLQLNESGATLLRAARRLGLVQPGEQLVIVKGIPAWRRARAAQSR
jgi:cell division protein FtsB